MFIENCYLLLIFLAVLCGVLGLAGLLAEHLGWE